MHAVGYQTSLPASDQAALLDITLPDPVASGHDLLVRVEAVSVNPIDTKMRMRAQPKPGAYAVLGWDAAGTVAAVGPDCTRYRPGDRVFYAGALTRPGTNAELHLVHEDLVGPMPRSLSVEQAAALPLTSITAWEALFERLDVNRPVAGANALLIVGGAGGVGSIAIQLARALTGLTVIATASRPETQDWARSLGAHHVVDHSGDLAAQVKALGVGAPGFVFSTTHTHVHYDAIARLIAPQGRLALIDDPEPFDVVQLKRKSVSLHWESMFTRSLYATADMAGQRELLTRVAELVDAGRLRTTLAETYGRINAANLRRAHARIESGTARGKIVLSGFGADA